MKVDSIMSTLSDFSFKTDYIKLVRFREALTLLDLDAAAEDNYFH